MQATVTAGRASAVQEVVAGAPMQDCTRTMVVTNNEFTPAARKLAELHGCELVGGAELPRLKSILRRAAAAERAP
ncbi:restriction endonuclease [Mycolicibacterium conceptionense]|uniref:Restriction endonuclease n=1 Tax=Mycolicibacterium conceptionense TaxID=451644 RepID=A0A0U1D348_9MYCO|nr:restriction endonuclease [Mycolicibacterium conceptionense]